jgi:hypothetical protein
VVQSVSNCGTIKPPMIVTPSGRLSSELDSLAITNGTAPNNVAIVVTRIGQKRSIQAW